MSRDNEMTEYLRTMQQVCDEGSETYTQDFVRGFQHGMEMAQACFTGALTNTLGMKGWPPRPTPGSPDTENNPDQRGVTGPEGGK